MGEIETLLYSHARHKKPPDDDPGDDDEDDSASSSSSSSFNEDKYRRAKAREKHNKKLLTAGTNVRAKKKTDHIKIVALVEAAYEFAREVLAPGGTFLAKVLQGGTEASLLGPLKRDFTTVKHVKPAASRSDSAELYLLATGFRGETA